MVYYLLYWHLPAYLTLFDLRLFPDGEDWSTTNQPGFGAQGDLGGTVLGQQLSRLATRLPGNFGSTSTGALVLTRNHQYNNDRTGVVKRMTIIANSDTEAVASDRSHRLSTGQVMGDGLIFTQGQVVPVLSVAPGRAPSASGGKAQIQGLIVGSQIDLNRVTGAHYAILNIPQSIDVTCLNSLDVFEPCLNYRVGLQVTANDFDDPVYGEAWRRIFDIPFDRASLSQGTLTKWCYLQSATVSRAEGSKGVRLRLVPEVTSTPGATLPVPQSSAYPGIGAFPFNDPSLPPLNFDVGFDFTYGSPGVGTYEFSQIDFPPLAMDPPPPPPQQLSQYGVIPDESDVFAVVSQGGELHIVGTDLESLMLGSPTWQLKSTFGYDDGTYSFGDMILDPHEPATRAILLKQDASESTNFTVNVCEDITASTWAWDLRQTLGFNPPEKTPYCNPSPTRLAFGVPNRIIPHVYFTGRFGVAKYAFDQDIFPENTKFFRTLNDWSSVTEIDSGFLGTNFIWTGDDYWDVPGNPNSKAMLINGIGYVATALNGGAVGTPHVATQDVYLNGTWGGWDFLESGFGSGYTGKPNGGSGLSPHWPYLDEAGNDNDSDDPYLLTAGFFEALPLVSKTSDGGLTGSGILYASDVPEMLTWFSWRPAFTDAYTITTSKTIAGRIAVSLSILRYDIGVKLVEFLNTYFTSDDSGATWTQRFSNLVADRTASGASANVLRFTDAWVDPEGDDVLVIGGMNRIQTSPNWGDLMTDGSGNLTSLLGSNWQARKLVYTGGAP